MISNWYVTSFSFLCCVFICHLFSERATPCCCNPSIPSSLSMAAWLPVPPCSCHPGTGADAAALRLMHTHPRNTATAIFFFLISTASLPPSSLPAFHTASVTPIALCLPLLDSWSLSLPLCVLAPLQEAPANKSVWTWLFPFGTSYA